jgi:Luciferase-like monooxygenase
MSAVTSARPRPLHFAAFVMNTTSHIIQGTWRRPTARQADFNDLGIAFTASVLQEHPFNFARRISTLDHASKGRIAWNIVTNYLPNASRNFGLDG